MTEHGHKPENKEESAAVTAPFTAEQIQFIRGIVGEKLEKYDKRQLQARRFGLPLNAETKKKDV